MSNRQARNRRKAVNRRNRILARECAPPGFSAYMELADFGHQIVLCMTRYSDGARCGANYQPLDHLWRHKDHIPALLTAKLMQWFDNNPVGEP